MSYSAQRTFTKPLTAALTLTETDKVTSFSIFVASGTCTIQGGGKFRGENSTAITIPEGSSYTETASDYSFLVGTIITPVGGTTNISLKR